MAIEHKNIPDAQLHEPKGFATASDEEVYVADGAGSGEFKDTSEIVRMGTENYDQSTLSTQFFATTYKYFYNDGGGSNTILDYKLSDVGNTWDTVNAQFDFTDYNPGDWIDVRLDVNITTGAANQVVEFAIEMASGDAGQFDLPVARKQFKTAGTYREIFLYKIFIGSEFVRDNPAKLKHKSDTASGSISYNGWALQTMKRGLV